MPRGRAPAIAELGPTWKEHPLGLVVRQPRYHVPIKFSLPISLQRWPSFFPCQSGPWWWRASRDLRWTVQRPSWTRHWSTPQPHTAWPTSCSITGSGPPRSWRYNSGGLVSTNLLHNHGLNSSRPICRNGGPGKVRQGGTTAIFCPFNFLWRNLQRTQKFTIFLANLLPPSIKAIWVSVTNVVSIPWWSMEWHGALWAPPPWCGPWGLAGSSPKSSLSAPRSPRYN